jgi:hypothetical protein
MIGYRQVLVVREQRVFRTKHASHVGSVVNGRIEIGEIADLDWQQHPGLIHWKKEFPRNSSIRLRGTLSQQLTQTSTQG